MTVKELAKKEPGGLISRAYRFAEKAHTGQKRMSGEPYFTHPLATAELLLSWNLDETSVAAGLLHDTVEDTKTARSELQDQFGDDVTFVVEGVTKLGRIKYHGEDKGTEVRAENLRKMILALSQDLRVVFVKLADRLHNMRTLAALPPAKQKRIALETDEVYAPLAYRLGMQNVSGELHDLAFPYLHPAEHRWLTSSVKEEHDVRLTYLKKIKPLVEHALREAYITPYSIDFRAKRVSSLYRKLQAHSMDLTRIYDLVAFRIITKNVADCYAALGVIHHLWPPLPGRIKDYIAMSKPNGYRSLHTTVFGPDGKHVEFQIRTKEMHEEDENGIAAHWLYEQRKGATKGTAVLPSKKLEEELRWVEQLKNWQTEHAATSMDAQKFMETMKIDFFKDRIFVITPMGDVLDLPADSTPVDFAYQIHTTIGNEATGARVNGELRPLDHKLQSGDVVEILTQKNKKPSEDWLAFVRTSGAREHIRAIFRKKGRVLQKNIPSKTEFRITAENRIGILKDISTRVAEAKMGILTLQTHARPEDRFPYIRLVVDTGEKSKIDRLVIRLRRIKGVREISAATLR